MKTKTKFDRGFDGTRHRERMTADLGGGFAMVAYLEDDSPEIRLEFDAYTKAELAAYEAGEWHFGTVKLWLAFAGRRVSFASMISGIEIHPGDDDGYAAATEAAEELLSECNTTKMVRDWAKTVARAAAKAMKKGGIR